MDFFNTDLMKLIWLVICTIALVALMLMLVKSAFASFKKSGRLTSVLDEIVIGIIVVFAYVLVIGVPLATLASFFKTPIVAIWNMILAFLRQVGIPI